MASETEQTAFVFLLSHAEPRDSREDARLSFSSVTETYILYFSIFRNDIFVSFIGFRNKKSDKM